MKKDHKVIPTSPIENYLSSEDIDLLSMTIEERLKAYTFWLKQMQVTNEQDKYDYTHGVFVGMKEPRKDQHND